MVVPGGAGKRPPNTPGAHANFSQPEGLVGDHRRIFADDERAFVHGCLPGEDGDYEEIHAALSSTRVAMRS